MGAAVARCGIAGSHVNASRGNQLARQGDILGALRNLQLSVYIGRISAATGLADPRQHFAWTRVAPARKTAKIGGAGMKRLGLLVILLAAMGCGSSSAPAMMAPTANVAGTWNITITNSGAAKFVNCTGDFSILEGLTFEAVIGASTITCTSPPIVVTQSGTAFTVTAQSYACSDGTSGTTGGGGTVSGNSISGQLDTISNSGWVATELSTGSVAGTALTLNSSRITYSGSLQGGCSFSPQLNYTGNIIRAPTTSKVGITGSEFANVVAAYVKSGTL